MSERIYSKEQIRGSRARRIIKAPERAIQFAFAGSSCENFDLIDWRVKDPTILSTNPAQVSSQVTVRNDPSVPKWKDLLKRTHKGAMLIYAEEENWEQAERYAKKNFEGDITDGVAIMAEGWNRAGVMPRGASRFQSCGEDYRGYALRTDAESFEAAVGSLCVSSETLVVPDGLKVFPGIFNIDDLPELAGAEVRVG